MMHAKKQRVSEGMPFADNIVVIITFGTAHVDTVLTFGTAHGTDTLWPGAIFVCHAEPVARLSDTPVGSAAQRQCSHTCSRPRSTGPLPYRYSNRVLSCAVF
jgi:hypothetical protein